jgi:mannose/cellobiose epimerase-like protein (N-acyl-D-glucosamine 2-epimerase family)
MLLDPDNPATLRPWLTEHVCRYWLACVHDPAGGFFESRDALGSAVANQRRSTLVQARLT